MTEPASRTSEPIWLIPFVVASALFMENLDSSAIATALPVIARDLGQDDRVAKKLPGDFKGVLVTAITPAGGVPAAPPPAATEAPPQDHSQHDHGQAAPPQPAPDPKAHAGH